MNDSEAGVEGFLTGLRQCGIDPDVRQGVVVFPIDAVDGAYAGRLVETGVSTDELGAWPAIPPHWVHLPAEVQFARSNTQASDISGWTKHSRGMTGWGDAENPSQAYLAHVRGIVGEAA